MEMRDYQSRAISAGVEFFETKNTRPSLIIAPTGAGKSWIVAGIAKELNEPLIVIQPTKELLVQNFEKFKALGGEAEIFSASFNLKNLGRITYATVGSIIKYAHQIKEMGIKYLICDEIHCFPRSIEGQLRTFILHSGITHILGLTATAFKLQNNTSLEGERFSKLQMLTSRSKHGNMFKDIIHITQIQHLIRNNWWCPLIYEIFPFNRKNLVINSTGADYKEESVRTSYQQEDIHNKIIENISSHADRKHILVFVPSIEEAILLSKKVENSACVYSRMLSKERDRLVKEFKEGKIRVIFNVNIFSVGFDFPALDMIIIAKPTISLAVYYQMIGRLVRIHKEKRNGLVVDLCGNYSLFGKIEDLEYRKNTQWQLFDVSGRQLTNISLKLLI